MKPQTALAPLVSLLSIANPSAAQLDPGLPGPHSEAVITYGAFTKATSPPLITNRVVEEFGSVTYPQDLNNGPYPLVFIIHGANSTCFGPNGWSVNWYDDPSSPNTPCPSGSQPYSNFHGYHHIQEILASHGFIVVSISANGLVAAGAAVADPWWQLIGVHRNLWAQFANGTNAEYPQMNVFNGAVDMARVGLIGHSRGGRAILEYAANSSPSSRPQALLAIAPLSSVQPISNIPVSIMLGYCDHDVEDLPGVRQIDGVRYADPNDSAPKYTVLSLGSNHNYFNSLWATDDWTSNRPSDSHCSTSQMGNGRLSVDQQHAFSASYASAFFRRHLQVATVFDPVLRGDVIPATMQTTAMYHSYIPAAGDRLDINRVLSQAEGTLVNSLGGSVTPNPALTIGLCGPNELNHCIPWASQTSMVYRAPHLGHTALVIQWTPALTNRTWANAIPQAYADFTNFTTLQFRVAVDPLSAIPTDPSALFAEIVDGSGRSQRVATMDFAVGDDSALYTPPGEWPAAVMNTVRIPLDAFDDIDRTNIASVALGVGAQTSGSLLVSDLAMADRRMSVAQTMTVVSMF